MSTHSKGRMALLTSAFIAAATVAAQAQPDGSGFILTSMTGSGSPRVVPSDGTAVTVDIGMTLSNDSIELSADQDIMLHSAPDAVVIVLRGPARAAIRPGPAGLVVELHSGRMTAMTSHAGPGTSALFRAVAGDATLAEGTFPKGVAYAMLEGGNLDLGHENEGGTWTVNMGQTPVAVAAGRRVSIQNGQKQDAELQAWVIESGLDVMTAGRQLGIESARFRRAGVNVALFDRISYWERVASTPKLPTSVKLKLAQPDIRQTNTTVTTSLIRSSNPSTGRANVFIPNANSVPNISPAAISVGGTAQVTALNANAQSLLTATGSQGLGFAGLSQLSIPGILNGLRTLGPAGLAGQQRLK